MDIAVLVPAPDYPEPWAWAFDVEAEALRAAGARVDAVAWTAAADFGGYDLVLPLVAWGYHLDYSRWLGFLDEAEAAGARMINPPALLRWNGDKAYLKELSAKGIPTVDTVEVEQLSEADLVKAAELFGTVELVVKPPVSASATGTHRIGVGDPIPASERDQRMMIQPFLPSIATEGEYAVILFDSAYSHTVVKRPKSGDFRVQPHLGGVTLATEAPVGAEELARAALAAAPAKATYARVDIVPDDDGLLRIMELELIEPALFLDHAPDGGAAFTRSILAAAQTATA